MKMDQIAAQLFTVREYTQNAISFENSIARISAMGYKAVQVSAIGELPAEKVKEICDRYAVAICATHIPFGRLTGDFDAVAAEHKIWGCKAVGVGMMPQEFPRTVKGFASFAAELNTLGRRFAGEGLQLIYHNHKFEFEKFDGVTGLELLLENTDPKNVCFEIDTYWVQAGGANPVDWIYKVKGRMPVVHFKDMSIKNDAQTMAEIGEGNIDFTSVIKACDETGVKWAAVEQDICPGDPFDSLKLSFDNLSRMLG